MTENLSRTFTALRFPMIIGILFIHIYATQWEISGVVESHTQNATIFDYIRNLFSRTLATTAVPIFFIMSAFLFFKADKFDSSVYKKNIKSRLRSIVVPYFFWNVLFCLIYIIATNLPFLNNFIAGSSPLSNNPNFENIANALLGFKSVNGSRMPIVAQLWFIRNLFIYCLLSPLFYLIIKYTRGWVVIITTALWVTIPQMSCIEGILFFNLGIYFRYYNTHILENFKSNISKISLICYPLLIVADVATKEAAINYYIHNIGVILGILFLFNFFSFLTSKGRLKKISVLASISFFLFLIHEPMMSVIRKLLYTFIQPNSQWLYIFIYFLSPLITIALTIALYKMGKRYVPTLMNIAEGGR